MYISYVLCYNVSILEKDIIMRYIVTTQYMENYGFDDPKPYQAWKMKFGGQYIVHDVTSPQNAMAFVAEKLCLNQPGFTIEYPTHVEEFRDDIPGMGKIEHVSPDSAKVFI